MDATIIPKATAISPFNGLRPESTDTIEKPRIVSSKSSGTPNDKTNGRATRIKTLRTTAPNNPPNSEDMNAADKARAACPWLDKGKPSKTVA